VEGIFIASTRLKILALFVIGLFAGIVLVLNDLPLALQDQYLPGDEVILTLVRGGQTGLYR